MLCLFAGASVWRTPGVEVSNAYSRQQTVSLQVGESWHFSMGDSEARNLRLLAVEEDRDAVVRQVRLAHVRIQLDGQVHTLRCGPYVMPASIAGLRLLADTTSGFESTMDQRVQLSVWNLAEPIVDPAKFTFPLADYELFSQGAQVYNEVIWQGRGDGLGNKVFYHNYGIDLTGCAGRDEVRSPVAGTVLGTWIEQPSSWDRGSVVVVGEDGRWWELAHLDSVWPGIGPGVRVAMGAPVGRLGDRGPSGGFPHLHLGSYYPPASKTWQADRRLNLYPWLVAAHHAQTGRSLYAMAGGHQLRWIGEEARFDGIDSVTFAERIVSWRWRFSDGDQREGCRVNKTFSTPGVHSAVLWVEDASGRRDAMSCEIKVFPVGEPKPWPRLALTCHPSRARVGAPVMFHIGIVGEAGATVSIALDYGDGTVAEPIGLGQKVAHAYKRPGAYIVTARMNYDGAPIVRQIKVAVGAVN